MKVRKTVLAAVWIVVLSGCSGPGEQGPDQIITHLNLNKYFNNDGISSKDNLGDGNFTMGILYPAESLPADGKVFSLEGLSFKFPRKKRSPRTSL